MPSSLNIGDEVLDAKQAAATLSQFARRLDDVAEPNSAIEDARLALLGLSHLLSRADPPVAMNQLNAILKMVEFNLAAVLNPS